MKLNKACSFSTFVNVGIFAISIVIRNLRILRNDYSPTYILWFLSSQLYLTVVTIFTFFCNFQQFIVIALREVKTSLQESECSTKKFEKSLTNLIKIENFLEAFEKNFGFQLTLVAVNYVFSIVTFCFNLVQTMKSNYDNAMKLTSLVTFLPFIIQVKLYLTNLAEDVENEKMSILMILNNHLSHMRCEKNHHKKAQELSIKFLLKSNSFKIFNMISLDHELMHSIVSMSLLYFIVLIQYEMGM
ncbi:hypothetical protein ACKWTF_005289 [Chironomus riparius]